MTARRRPGRAGTVFGADGPIDPDLVRRRARAAALAFGCHHSGRHHFLSPEDAAAAPAPRDPGKTFHVARCCEGGYAWLPTR